MGACSSTPAPPANGPMAGDRRIMQKIVIIGDSAVGKTCLLLRFAEGTYSEALQSTLGQDFKVKKIALDDGRSATLQIWDTAGQERFRPITSSLYRGVHAVMLAFSIDSR